MRKTLWALPLATALMMTIGVPAASAATGSTTAPNYYGAGEDTQNTHVAPLQTGDCTEFGQLSIFRPAADGVARVRFLFNTKTSRTKHYDQWHNSWKVVGFGNQTIATLGPIDGARMSTVNQFYAGEIDTTVSMTTSQWLNIATVTWTGSC
jgi:hypothetical protein